MELLRDMALFVQVADMKSFSRAAEALGMAASSLSRRIGALEQGIGARLLNRSTRRLELTPAGEQYLSRCRRVIDEARLAHEDLRGDAQTPRGLLRVSMPPDVGLVTLCPLLEDFTRRYPEIRFALDLSPVMVDLVAGNVDVAIRAGELADSGLVARRLATFARGLYAAPAYLARAGTPAAPADLARHECILGAAGGTGQRYLLTRRGRRAHVVAQGRFFTNNGGMMRELAVAGHGIAVLPEDLARAPLRQGLLRRVLPEWEAPRQVISALTPSRLLPVRTRVFLDYLAERLK